MDQAPVNAVNKETTTVNANNNNNGFDYTAYWQDVMQKAQASLQQEAPRNSSPCPKVYVYDLSKFNEIDTKNHPRQFGSEAKITGRIDSLFRGYLHKTNQYAFCSILEQRLLTSSCRTLDPNEADLFFAPILSSPKGSGGWASTCQAITGEEVRDALPFLNETNACRHFFAIGKGHTDNPYCKGWFSYPIPELKPFSRLSYSSFNFMLDEYGAHYYDPNDNITVTHPNMVSVPYPSSLHFYANKTVPHFDQVKRRVLMSFIGKDNHGDTKVRERIHKLCKKYKDPKICDYRLRFIPEKDATSKAKTVFCLEPAGDTPGRKSLSDSIAFGCIPVLFSELSDDVAPWHWSSWKDRARVLVPREEFVAGRIDLKILLQSMPPELLALMKRTLKEKARQFQYSLDDDQEDGVRAILDNLHLSVQDKVQRGVCGH